MRVGPVGLLVIRVWVEEGSERPLRAEVKSTSDTRLGFDRQATLSEAEAVVALISAWLQETLNTRA